MANMETWEAPTAARMKVVCKTHNLLTDDVSIWLEDYQHYRDTGEKRRKDQFVEG
jgi:hypothetical protein